MSLANKHSWEGELTSEFAEFPPIPLRKLIITNDSTATDIKFKFNPSESFSTLKAGETLQIEDVRITFICLQGQGAKYRVWGLG